MGEFPGSWQHEWQITADREGWLPPGKALALRADLQAARASLYEVSQQRNQAIAEAERLRAANGDWKLSELRAFRERDRFRAQAEELAEALSWALDVLEITLKRLDSVDPPRSDQAGVEHLQIRAAGQRKAREVLARFRGGSDG